MPLHLHAYARAAPALAEHARLRCDLRRRGTLDADAYELRADYDAVMAEIAKQD